MHCTLNQCYQYEPITLCKPTHPKRPLIPSLTMQIENHPRLRKIRYFEEGGGVGGSRVCVWPGADIGLPSESWRHITVSLTQGLSSICPIVALFFGSSFNIDPIISLLSLGRRRSNLSGPLITSGFGGSGGFFDSIELIKVSISTSEPQPLGPFWPFFE